MDLPLPPDHWSIERLTEERTAAVGDFGFTPRQARFLVEVLIHSGVFVERQTAVSPASLTVRRRPTSCGAWPRSRR